MLLEVITALIAYGFGVGAIGDGFRAWRARWRRGEGIPWRELAAVLTWPVSWVLFVPWVLWSPVRAIRAFVRENRRRLYVPPKQSPPRLGPHR
jgi:hypothetical protein